jgi:hypothetical protein
VIELCVDPGVETGTGWTFTNSGAALAQRTNLDPNDGSWHAIIGRVVDGLVIGGYRNASAYVTLDSPPVDEEITVSVYVKSVNGLTAACDYDNGDGTFVLLGSTTTDSSYARWLPGAFIYVGPGAPRVRFRPAAGGAGNLYVDTVNTSYNESLDPYPPGPPIFQESYTDALRGTIHKRKDTVRDAHDRVVWDYDLDPLDRDDVLIDWMHRIEGEDIEP